MSTASSPVVLVTMSRRERLWHAAGKTCHWCRKPTRLILSPLPDQATVDHVIPRCRGGADNETNCVSACLACNQRRNNEDMRQPGHPSAELNSAEASQIRAKRARSLFESMQGQRDSAVAQLRKVRIELAETKTLLGIQQASQKRAEQELAGWRNAGFWELVRRWLLQRLQRAS